MDCILCNSSAERFFISKERSYFSCKKCSAVFMNPAEHPTISEEETRYSTHNNDVNNLGYQKFVKPIIDGVLIDYKPPSLGLDFGCGTGPVITKLLNEKGFNIKLYDPIFKNDKSVLYKTYDFIVCCEVIEHFHNPLNEFKLLKSLLKNSGKLYCMTDLFSDDLNFEKWYYKNDLTHVIFYQKNTFNWIKEKLGFSKVTVNNRLITFEV